MTGPNTGYDRGLSGGFGPSTYGDAFADVYDRWYGDLPGLDDTVAAVERLAKMSKKVRHQWLRTLAAMPEAKT